jgi:hypothetical protein
MKINRLETHDRLKHLILEQSCNLQQGADDCLKLNPLSLALQTRSSYIYIFAHPRTCDDGVTKKMFWQPRLSKPCPQTNSYLFRAKSNTDIVEICWLLPPRETWNQYKKGNVTESSSVFWSIYQYINNRIQLGKPFPEDLPEQRICQILREIALEMDQDIRMKKMYQTKPDSSEEFSTVLE